jgi:hypothetical protein
VRKIFADDLRLDSIANWPLSSTGEASSQDLGNWRTAESLPPSTSWSAHWPTSSRIASILARSSIAARFTRASMSRSSSGLVRCRPGKTRRARHRTKARAIPFPLDPRGLIFDDRGNPMSPSHAKRKGVRYRYDVSQALLQNRKSEAGSIARLSAPDIEALVCKAVGEALKTLKNDVRLRPRQAGRRAGSPSPRLGRTGAIAWPRLRQSPT